jgi:hypothetical protein
MGLYMEVAEGSIGFPTADEPKFFEGDVAIKKGHGTGSAERLGSNVRRDQPGRIVGSEDGCPEQFGKLNWEQRCQSWTDSAEVDGAIGREITELLDTTGNRENRTSNRVAGEAMSNGLAASAILLGGKREAHKSSGGQILVGAGRETERRGTAPKLNI